jgi:hypothetical protein
MEEKKWNFFFQQNGGRSLLPEETLLVPFFFKYFSLSPLPNTYIKFWNKVKEAFFWN